MKKTSKLAIALAAIGAAALTVYLIKRNHHNRHKMLAQVSDEGYETAEDILFPGKSSSNKLHYGPVIPK